MDNGQQQVKGVQSPYFQNFAEQFVKANQHRAELLASLQSKADALLTVGEGDLALKNGSRRTSEERVDKPRDFSSMLREQIGIAEEHNVWLASLLEQFGRMV